MAGSADACTSRPSAFRPALLQAFCSQGVFCAFTGLYPSYVVGVFGQLSIADRVGVCHLYIAKPTSAI